MELPSNPFAVLTFISAPAVLTNASCVLLFGTGNRYGRAVDRTHELADTVLLGDALDAASVQLRVRQLRSAQARTLLIVRALTCFYIAVAAFIASTLVSLVGAILVSSHRAAGVPFGCAFVAGTIGVAAIMGGALMLALETRFSFSVLREENAFIMERVSRRGASVNATH